jgi:hypothetical protein
VPFRFFSGPLVFETNISLDFLICLRGISASYFRHFRVPKMHSEREHGCSSVPFASAVNEDAGVFDIRRSSSLIEQSSSDSFKLVSSQDDLNLLRASSSSLEVFSADSFLLQQRPVPSVDYFNELKLSSSVDREDPSPPSAAERAAPKAEEKKPEEVPKVAKLIYIEEPDTPVKLTSADLERLAQKEASRLRKAQRYIEKKKLLEERPPTYFSSVTHVSDPAREIMLYDSDRAPERRSVTPGNAAKVLTGRGWVTGFVSYVNAAGTRVGISYHGVSNSWWNQGRPRIFTSVLPYYSSDWHPVRTRTIPGTARRGRPAKIDSSTPSSGHTASSSHTSSSYSPSYTSPSYRAPPANEYVAHEVLANNNSLLTVSLMILAPEVRLELRPRA